MGAGNGGFLGVYHGCTYCGLAILACEQLIRGVVHVVKKLFAVGTMLLVIWVTSFIL